MSRKPTPDDEPNAAKASEYEARKIARRAAAAAQSDGNGVASALEGQGAEPRRVEAVAGAGEAVAKAYRASDAASPGIAAVESGENAETAPQVQEEPAPEEDNHIQRRAAARKKARAIELKKKQAEDEISRHLMERALRAKPKPPPEPVTPFWPKVYSATIAFVTSKTLHATLASCVLAAMVGGVGFYAYTLYQAQTDAAFRDHCRENNMKYASGSRQYCYDDNRFAHQITDDGVTGRLDLDWKVNERLLRLAMRQADRFAKSSQADVAEAPQPIGVAAGTIAELSAQLARISDIPREPGIPAGATVSYLQENGPKIIHIRQRRPGDDGIP